MPDLTNTGSIGPLADLENQGYHVHSFQYPIDLVTDPGEGHFMMFYINESYNTQFPTKSSNDSFDADGKSSFKPEGGKATPIINKVDSKYNANWNARPVNRVATAIALYFPPNITTTYSTQWEGVELGVLGAGMKAFMGKDGASLDSLASTVKAGLVQAGLNGSNDATATLKAKLMEGAGDVAGAAQMALRIAVPAHLEMLFKGIGFREFQFDFKFYPRSEQEQQNVFNIVKAFKFYSAPELKEGTDSPKCYIFPAEFDIEFWSQGKPNDYINKISTSALTDVSVNYTGAGNWSSFRAGNFNGAPVETHLSLKFKELELITKRRILQGY